VTFLVLLKYALQIAYRINQQALSPQIPIFELALKNNA
jgi:hypothetical protein